MVGIILRNIREIKRMKQKQVADYLRVEENTISNYERERSSITFETAIKFIRGCDFDIQIVDKENNKVYTIDEL